MDKLDNEIRKRLLKPLLHRTGKDINCRELSNSFEKLEERAYGVHLVSELIPYIKSSKNKKSWEDPEEARKYVALAKAMYMSRKISTQEYVFYAVYYPENINESRMINGTYDNELGDISSKMQETEDQYLLETGAGLTRNNCSKEYSELDKQWGDIFELKFIDVLQEFGLEDLAELKRTDSERFDNLRERGRRAVFHADEQVPAIRDIVVRYEDDARRAASIHAYSGAVISLGAAIEGLLILRCLKSPTKATRIARKITKRHRPSDLTDPTTWRFTTLIEVCGKAGWLPPLETETAKFDAVGLAYLIRLLRNYVHPGRYYRERPWSEIGQRDYDDAEAIFVVLNKALGSAKKS